MRRRALLFAAVLIGAAWPAAAQYDDFGGDVPYVPTPAAVVEAMLNSDMGEWAADEKVEVNGRTLYLWEVTEKAKAQFAEREQEAAGRSK